MTLTNNSTSQFNQGSLVKRMVVGALIGLALISFFLYSAGQGDPAWGKFWMIRPLVIVPLAGAMGGLCNYFIVQFHNRIGVNKIVAIIFSVIIFIIGLWIGSVLGLDGTWWD